MNETIVQLIRAARVEAAKTQKDLAEHLNKTPAAISDLERGKVQVTASDLYQIAQLLNKPIEYFYGENIGDKEIQEVIAVWRKQPPKDRAGALQITTMLLRLQSFTDELKKYPPDEKIPAEKVKEFYNLFVPFATALKAMSQQAEKLRKMFNDELKTSTSEKPRHSKKKK